MLTVRAVSRRRFALVRVSERGARVLHVFDNEADAVQRWNEMEDELRRLTPQST